MKTQKTTWILCPNLWGARLFTTDNFNEVPRFFRELPRPKVRLRHEDFDTDEDIPELTEDPRDHDLEIAVAKEYSAQVAHFLEKSAKTGLFSNLILCAERQFLSILKENLQSRARSRLIGEVEEDLYEVNETDLAGYVKPFKKKAA